MIRLLPRLGAVSDPVQRERPDFCLALAGGRLIGLEHTPALDEQIAAGRGARKRLKAQVQVLAGLRAAGPTCAITAIPASARLHGAAAGARHQGEDHQRRLPFCGSGSES